jgi:apolipoprotein N-acyltransferase
MNRVKLALWTCVLLSAVLMSLPWLVPHCGGFALVGLVPLLCADHIAMVNKVRRFRIWHYSFFVLWNAATTWWVANATVGGAIFAILANSLQMSLIFGLFRFGKRRLKGILPYILLAAAWIAWERWYLTSAQISWPWLVLGNAFAQSTRSIQWYEFTGVLGGSVWVWVCNITVFMLLKAFIEGDWAHANGKTRLAATLWLALIFVLPYAASGHIYHHYREVSEGELPVIIGQPNFDPYEKFHSKTQAEQTAQLLSLFERQLPEGEWNGLLLAPETFTGDVYLGHIPEGNTFRSFQHFLKGHPGASLLFGASTYEVFDRRRAPSILARRYGDKWIENHNSAIMTDASGRAEVFHKSKLVVGTELTPYPKIFVPIDNLLGGVMGRCIGQPEIACLHLEMPDKIAVGTAVCYESVYGEYCTGYVRKGAQVLAVITNDAWWGDTPGYRQHFSYSCLRAIETRRDIARCGNTGISAIIDQRGDVLSRTLWWRPSVLSGTVSLSSKETFFVRYGDICGRAAGFLFLLMLLALLVSFFRR